MEAQGFFQRLTTMITNLTIKPLLKCIFPFFFQKKNEVSGKRNAHSGDNTFKRKPLGISERIREFRSMYRFFKGYIDFDG